MSKPCDTIHSSQPNTAKHPGSLRTSLCSIPIGDHLPMRNYDISLSNPLMWKGWFVEIWAGWQFLLTVWFHPVCWVMNRHVALPLLRPRRNFQRKGLNWVVPFTLYSRVLMHLFLRTFSKVCRNMDFDSMSARQNPIRSWNPCWRPWLTLIYSAG